jgi:hypothetical protein
MSRATAKPTPMACLTIGYSDYLMPSDKAMKVAELMQHAIECESSFEGTGYVYTAKETPNVEFSLVRPNQVRMPHGKPVSMPPARPRLLR